TFYNSEKQSFELEGNSFTGLAVGDFDSNGDFNDVMLVSPSLGLAFFVNTGAEYVKEPDVYTLSKEGYTDLLAADFIDDGKNESQFVVFSQQNSLPPVYCSTYGICKEFGESGMYVGMCAG